MCFLPGSGGAGHRAGRQRRRPRLPRRSGCRGLAAGRAAGAAERVTALLHRDPVARVSLDNPDAVGWLLDSLRATGAQEQVTALIDRLPGAGLFVLLREQEDGHGRFRFGREANGSPAQPW